MPRTSRGRISDQTGRIRSDLLQRLVALVRDLDGLGESLAAVHVQTALDILEQAGWKITRSKAE